MSEKTKRKIIFSEYTNVHFHENKIWYPDIIFDSNEVKNFNPIDEPVMSLKNAIPIPKEKYIPKISSRIKKTESHPLFFFIYNFENYYHFIYDTLPFLISFQKFKSYCKLLVNYPKSKRYEFFKFNLEFFELLCLDPKNDFVFVDDEMVYEKVYISSSFTHDGQSESPPHPEIFKFFQNKIVKPALSIPVKMDLPKRFYISRRTHLLNEVQKSNIGTNYTQRRCLINEDDVLQTYQSKYFGLREVFCESLTTVEKIHLFHKAEIIIGCVGGGTTNILFCDPLKPPKMIEIIVSPDFYTFNSRFDFCLDWDIRIFRNIVFNHNTVLIEVGPFRRFGRVQFIHNPEIIGEVNSITSDGRIEVFYTEGKVSGFSEGDGQLQKSIFKPEDLKCLDNGINSAFKFLI